MESKLITSTEYIELANTQPTDSLIFKGQTRINENGDYYMFWEDIDGNQYKTKQRI